MSSLNNLIEPPLENCTPKTFGKVFESPVQPVQARSRIVASPTYLGSNGRSSNLIDAPAPHILTLSSPKHKRPRLSTHPMASVKHRKHGTSPLSQPSPNIHVTDNEKSDYNRTDKINWDVHDEQVNKLKTRLLPNYWESLQEAPCSIIRISTRLYLIQDWNVRFGYLIVKSSLHSFTDIFI